ncbi:MAG: HAD-IA family hydrolase [Nitriliruptoraceae bacterium]|nr:HAD-IA family hydrolase [Nitriliruptoraceae bacterium]
MTDAPWVLFDLDGTLFDYEAAESAAVEATLREAGLAPTPAVVADYRRANAALWGPRGRGGPPPAALGGGRGGPVGGPPRGGGGATAGGGAAGARGETTPDELRVERWRTVLATHGVGDVDTDALSAAYVAHLAQGTQLIAGAQAVLDRIARDHRIAYITNGLADVQRPRLRDSRIGDYAEVTVISDEVGAAKPDPIIFATAMARMGGPDPGAVTMVGDSLSADIAGGNAAGLATVWVARPGGPPPGPDEPVPTHRIADLRELPALLGA